ncbi:MAG: hypothetical protein ABL959_25050, partial [Pyrinomonadaceae bacterium]
MRMFGGLLIVMLFLSAQDLVAQKTAEDYFKRGNESVTAKDYSAAITDFSIAISIDPKYIAAYRSRGLARALNKNFAGAIIDLTKVIEFNPNDATAY